MAMSGRAVRRSATFKQFLLRVHPDHFRAIPKVHDENLHSIQLLNQFMDEQHAFSSSHPHHRERKRVFFNAYIPATSARDSETDQKQLKRFRLDLAANIEDHMRRILRECGVEIAPTETTMASSVGVSPHRESWDYDRDRFWSQTAHASSARGGMDYGFNEHFAQYAHSRRRRRAILTLREFFAFADEPETREKQQLVRTAWESSESVKRTLVREFGLREIATSCGWASVPLNSTLMSLLKTLRKLKHSIRLDGVRLDVRADASEIDYFDEYTVVLNVADVPLQWVEVLEKVDDQMLHAIHAAYGSLQQLQHAAERALGGDITISRGRTCSAIAYRGFLQDMAVTAPLFADDPVRVDNNHQGDAVIEQIAVVVEDSVHDCAILDDGTVRAPSCSSAAHVLDFVDMHRDEIREQARQHATLCEQFEFISKQCMAVLGLKSLTYNEGLLLCDVNQASARLLALATDGSRYGSSATAEMLQSTHEKALRFDRFFGLAQDGVFTLPTDWRY